MTPTGTQFATAFDGPIESAGTSIGYRVAVASVFCAMILLPVVYLVIIAAAVAGLSWYATAATAIFSEIRGGRAMLAGVVLYVGPLIAGGLLVVFLVMPLFWKSRKTERPMGVQRREEPLLYAYVERLCDAMRVPRPARIDVTATANASAHIDNGVFGLVSRRLVLTIGLPLVGAMDLRQFTGVLAHELGHFAQGGSMRLSYVIHRINARFMALAYGRSGIDDALDAALGNEPHWTIAAIGMISRFALWLTRLVLMGLALLSHFLSMHLSRRAEFDADRRAARIVGGAAVGAALQELPFIVAANRLGIARARAGWVRRTLPDDLVTLTEIVRRHLPENVRNQITAIELATEPRWSDTHPPLFKRIAALKRDGAKGVLTLDAPAACLFKNFDEIRKVATIDLYQSVLGESLQPEHLVPTPDELTPLATPQRRTTRYR